MNPVRVLLVDDHKLVRAGVRALVQGFAGMEVIAEASNGREAMDLIAAHMPDVVLMDISMSSLNGLQATARVADKYPKVRVIILSMHASEEYVLQALRAGASGYLLKDAATAELELAIRAVNGGGTYLGPAISKRVIEEYLIRAAGRKTPLDQITARQREVLQLMAEGKTAKEIAYLLGVSVKTIETHRAQLMDRLDIHNVPGLVRFAMRTGLVSEDL